MKQAQRATPDNRGRGPENQEKKKRRKKRKKNREQRSGDNQNQNQEQAPDTRSDFQKDIDEAREKVEAIAERAGLPELNEKKNTKKKSTKGGKNKLTRMTSKEAWKSPEKKKKFILVEMAENGASRCLTLTSTLAYLGYKVPAKLVEGSATLTDRFFNRMAKLGDSWMSKKVPGMGFIDKMLNRAEKRLGLDKLLVDVIQEDRDKRQKLLDKLVKEENSAIKKYKDKEKKRKAKAKKEEEWKARYGEEVMKILKGEREDIEDNLSEASETTDAGDTKQKAAA